MNPRPALFTDSQLFELIVDASPAGMVIADAEGRIALVNAQALEYFGYEELELVGQPVEMLIPSMQRGAHVSQRVRYMENARPREMAAGRNLFALRKDGSEFPVDISLHPIKTDSGKMVLANIVDATQRRQAEKDREARQAMERLAMLGQLAGGVAHEIRTPLCVIGNDVYYLQTLSDQLGPDAVECIEEIKDSVAKANRIVSELLDFTRDPASTFELIHMTDLLAAAISASSIPESIPIEQSWEGDKDCTESSLQVLVDADQIERVLVNLLNNAVQAMQGPEVLLPPRLQIIVTCDDGEVVLRIIDTGVGVREVNRERVFEPLFTTKPKGIGLGLAVSRRYAERNHGTLTYVPVEHGGSCFTLTLPLHREPPSSDSESGNY